MPDRITSEQRSKVMSKIKSTSKLEDLVAHELFRRGVRYRRNNRQLLGKPDISISPEFPEFITREGQRLTPRIIPSASS